ncbi:hypothetical protein Fcan01_12788 [Folsomia candida]|uniref:Uncharacterized protein n=1 Tax=Folsomia candida TaxID=158441 RepID=A0A226E5M2_FOLCA|nr:hypothetical protein Fcan01_12788 [Folsomia candida]
MDKFKKVTLVEKFSKTEEEKSKEKDFKYVCNGGGEGVCISKRGVFKSNDEARFGSHISKVHKSEAEILKDEPWRKKYNKEQEDRDEEKEFIYVCNGGENGSCRSNFMTNVAADFSSHISTMHNVSNQQKMKKLAVDRKNNQQYRANSNVTANNTLKIAEGEPLLEIETETSDDDEESPSYLEFNPILESMKAEEQEEFVPYHASLFVLYYPEGKVDRGPMETYQLEDMLLKMNKGLGIIDELPFKMYLYFATSLMKTCIHLSNVKTITSQSRVVDLMNDGADYIFSEGTTQENREKAFEWQQYWKYVNQMRKRVKVDPYSVEIEILNCGTMRKIRQSYASLCDEKFHNTQNCDQPASIIGRTGAAITKPVEEYR